MAMDWTEDTHIHSITSISIQKFGYNMIFGKKNKNNTFI